MARRHTDGSWTCRCGIAGGKADYLREGAIRREGGQAFFDVSRSRTDVVLVYLGIAFGR
ncbi:MAG: hypothetical protein AB7Q16_06525 [Vicinamibacterales bacterium]